MNAAQRSLAVVRRLPAVARPVMAMQPARMGSSHAGEEAHHHHAVFEPPFNPWGAPFAIWSFVVVGGLGTVAFAFKWSMSGWKKP